MTGDFIGWAIGGVGVLIGVISIYMMIHFYRVEENVLQRLIAKLNA